MDPAALRILGYVPLPQTGAATNNFVYNSPSDQDQQTWDVRIDHVFSRNHNAYVRVSSQRLENKPNSPLPPDSNGNYVASGASDVSDNKSVAVVHNAVWSGNVIGSIRVGYNRIDWDEVVPPQDLRGVGIPGVDSSNPGFSQIAITGYRTLGVSNVPNADDSTNLQMSGDVSLTKGAHTIKTGRAALPARRSTSSARSAAAASSTSTGSTPATPSPTSCLATAPPRACRSTRS